MTGGVTGITGATQVFAVLGRPVRHSASPALHNAWFAAHGLDAVYVALEVPEGAEPRVVDAVRALGLAGANVTAPLKDRVVDQLDALDETARAVGAVNTIAREGDALVGANTDVEGFCRSVEARGVDLRGRDAVILGAGGAARAVAVGLAHRGAARIRIAARRPERAAIVAGQVGRAFPDASLLSVPMGDRAIAGADLVVVATSGRPAAVAASDPAALAEGAVWVDLNYWDPDPVGFRAAAARGCHTIDGRGMLHWQAALSFERWTGTLPEVSPADGPPS
jgi:shikimate dehydrogenase